MRPTSILRTRTAVLAIAFVVLIASSFSAFSRDKGEKTFGVTAGYVSRNETGSAGLAFQYRFSRFFRIAPQVGVIFRHENLDGLDVALNTHFIFPFSGGRAAFYPLTGINFTNWRRYDLDEKGEKDVSSHVNCIGLNGGAGIEFRCTPTLRLNIETYYTLFRKYSTAHISAGIAYIF